ncbi:MAG TPA: SagB/ThcOx family dehydrogenase [Bacteroidales bacterium]|nr:SagB/ThcOx family dehydrogenase [Bacteroidales bacterium]
MKKLIYIGISLALVLTIILVVRIFFQNSAPVTNEVQGNSAQAFVPEMAQQNQGTMINLPRPVTDGRMSLERALTLRRSIRSYTDEPLTMADLSQILWSGQGITNQRGFRTAPSAGATFPLELYVVVNNVEGLRKGIYHYQIREHSLRLVDTRQIERDLARAALGQTMVSEAGAVIVIAAIMERTTGRYGERGIRYVYNEVGHVGQNIHLQAAALNLGTVVIGAFRDAEVDNLLNIGEQYTIVYLMPVGKI